MTFIKRTARENPFAETLPAAAIKISCRGYFDRGSAGDAEKATGNPLLERGAPRTAIMSFKHVQR